MRRKNSVEPNEHVRQNKMNRSKIAFTLLLTFLSAACNREQQINPFVQSEYWKKQALNDILPPWKLHAMDSAHGSFFCTLDDHWKPVGDNVKFPSMISRHLFSYSSAYLMSGNEEYLNMAQEIKTYLFDNAWDNQYGGWFDALAPDGEPLQEGKSTFVQLYVITGLSMYYFVTHDPEVLDYINQSNDLLEKKAWDHNSGGYFDALERNWTVSSEVKSLSSQLAPVSGYLLYLYMATRDKKYLDQAERVCDVIIRNMIDTKSGWVLENFDKNWKQLPGKLNEQEINIGHNIEIAWSLLRLHLLNNRPDYLKVGTALADRVHQYGFNSENGFWFATIGNEHPDQHSDFTYWWIQAYGNMFDLCLSRLYPEQHYVDNFKKGAAFWHTYFLDKEKGDTHLSVLENGDVKDGQKANQFKASYHNLEHCLLNYLYLACWVNREPVTLYFKITSSKSGDALHPVPIEMLDAQFTDIRINDEPYSSTIKDFINLPELKDAAVTVTVRSQTN